MQSKEFMEAMRFIDQVVTECSGISIQGKKFEEAVQMIALTIDALIRELDKHKPEGGNNGESKEETGAETKTS